MIHVLSSICVTLCIKLSLIQKLLIVLIVLIVYSTCRSIETVIILVPPTSQLMLNTILE